MEAQDWKACPLVTSDPEIVHGEPVFAGTRMPVESAIENYYAFRELKGMWDEEALEATLESFPTIPGPEGLCTVLAYEAAHEHQSALALSLRDRRETLSLRYHNGQWLG